MSAHARLSCSGAYRWRACPGSPRLEAQFPETTSPYAEEGTRAHLLLETAALLGLERVADALDLVDGADAEMAEHLQPVLDWVRREQASRPGCEVFFERRVDPGKALGRRDTWGTVDIMLFDHARAEIVIGDLKYGAGQAVEATDNTQLRLYAVGALARVSLTAERVTMVILQPRAYHADGPVRAETLTRAELEAFAAEMKTAATATDDPDAPLIAGEHCHFCRAAGACSVLADYSLSVAREAFAALQQPLQPERVARLLREADTVRGWLKALEAHALELANSGTELPGWKLVARRGHRRWLDPDQALVQLATTYGVDASTLAPPALISPAQVEKVIKRETGKKPDLSQLAAAPELGPRLVPDSAQGEDVFAEIAELFPDLSNAA